MDGQIDEWMDVQMDGWMYRWMDGQIDRQTEDRHMYLVQNRNGLETVGVNRQNVFSVT